MNVLYLHCHDMGRYNGIYGKCSVTPNMVGFAKDSCVFQNAHCASPTCSPSRGAMLTGMLPHCNGLDGLTHRGFSYKDPKKHLAHFLKDHGYHTVLCGIQHESGDARELGYSEVHVRPKENKEIHSDEYATERALEFIEAAKEPFFLSVGYLRPHRNYDRHTDIDPDTLSVPACIPDNSQTREDYADYLTSLQKTDTNMGRVLRKLKESGLYEKTVVILTTDHGIAFPFMKNTLYDTGTGVTLAMRIPGATVPQRTDALVSQLDVFPTVCEALGLEKPAYLQGYSLSELINGKCEGVRDSVISEMNFHAMYEPARSIRTKRYKYILRYDFPECWKTSNVDDGKSKAFLMENGFAEHRYCRYELYDLYFDPGERCNLVNSPLPEHKRALDELSAALERHMRQTNDPLLKGYLEAPLNSNLKTQ